MDYNVKAEEEMDVATEEDHCHANPDWNDSSLVAELPTSQWEGQRWSSSLSVSKPIAVLPESTQGVTKGRVWGSLKHLQLSCSIILIQSTSQS